MRSDVLAAWALGCDNPLLSSTCSAAVGLSQLQYVDQVC